MQKLFLIVILLPLFSFGQNDSVAQNETKFGVGIVPTHAILNGLKFDFDLKLKNKHWLVVAPQFYVSSNGGFNHEYESMHGFGINLQHKIFVNKQKQDRGIYFAYGPTFNYYKVEDEGLVSYNFAEDGANYIGLKDDIITTNIYKVGGNAIVGIQSVIADLFYIDPYIGVGLRYSYDNKTSGLHKHYNDSWIDLGYSGTLLVTGVRLGFLF